MKRNLLTVNDLCLFWDSDTGKNIFKYIERLCTAVKGKSNTEAGGDKDAYPPVIVNMENMLDQIKGWIDKTPPDGQANGRFGNSAFRIWHQRLSENIKTFHDQIFGSTLENVDELCEYFLCSFGNVQRLDYGTGHELHFLIWLFCITRLSLLKPEYDALVVTILFKKYVYLMRDIQWAYWLEPAGSHGVWGLDDYHFLPFLFGASQLIGHLHIRPKSIHCHETIEGYASEYLYLDCIQFVNSVKSASLRWHSPLLDDISAVKSWSSVYSGLLKMYHAEVLYKLPVMQHFLTGTLIPYVATELIDPQTNETCCSHTIHRDIELEAIEDASSFILPSNTFPECCGIRVPSAMAAAAADKSKTPRRIPFD